MSIKYRVEDRSNFCGLLRISELYKHFIKIIMKKMLKNYLNVFLLRLLCCVRSMLEVLFLITRGSLFFFCSNSFVFASISWDVKQDSIFSNHPCSSAMWWRSENIKKETCQIMYLMTIRRICFYNQTQILTEFHSHLIVGNSFNHNINDCAKNSNRKSRRVPIPISELGIS